MKIRVVRSYIDKYTEETKTVGEEFIINKDRFAEINNAGYGILVEEIKKEVSEDVKKEETEDEKENDGDGEKEEMIEDEKNNEEGNGEE